MTDILGGKYLPFWIFPPVVRQIALVLPFRGINYTPLSILVEEVSLEQIPVELAIQVVWIILLAALGRLIYARAVRKLAVQGG